MYLFLFSLLYSLIACYLATPYDCYNQNILLMWNILFLQLSHIHAFKSIQVSPQNNLFAVEQTTHRTF